MATVAHRPPTGQIPPSVEEREEAPGYEALRQILRVVLVVSLALTAILAVFPLFGTLLLPALFACLAYVGLMIVSRLEHRKWKAQHPRPDASREVGFRVVTGGASSRQVERSDATDASEPGVPPARVAGAMSPTYAPRVAHESDDGGEAEMLSSPQRAGVTVALKIATVIVVMAAAVAAAIFDWRLLGVGAVLAVAYMALFGMPVWIASVEDAAEQEKERRLAGRR